MPVNFPNNPSNGDTYKVNNVTYTYVTASNKWKPGTVSTPSTGLDSAAVNSLISASPSSGTTTYDSIGALPLSGNSAGDIAFIDSADRLFVYNGAGWYSISLVNATPTISSVVDSDGGTAPFYLSTEGATTVITITASDSDGVPPTLTYGYSVTSGSLTNGGGTTATVVQDSSDTNVFRVTPTTTEAYAGDFTLTFTASDGINTGTSANEFSLAFSVVNSNYTTFLLQADTSGNDNQVDASSNSLTITEAGNVTSTPFSPYHPKGYSTYFDGSGDYLTISGAIFDPIAASTSRYTIEAWVYPTTSGGTIFHAYTANTNDDYALDAVVTSSTAVRFRHTDGSLGSDQQTQDVSGLVLNTWNYVSLEKDGDSSFALRVNTTTQSWSPTNMGSTGVVGRVVVGINTYQGSAYTALTGYVRDVRISNTNLGITGVPSSPLEVTSNTELLTCHLPYIADGSSNDHSITVTGNTKTELFSPYDHDQYLKSAHGGSVYFDGSSDYLSSTTSSAMDFGTGDFTIEFWMYPDNYTNGDVIADARAVWNDTGWDLEFKNNGIVFYSSGGDRLTSANLTTSAKQWTHVAFVRNSGTLNSFVNGVKDSGVSYTSNVNTTASTVRIGQRQDNGGTQFHGNLSDFRIVSSAVYTADFTPPTEPLTAITNTQLLTCTNKHSLWDATEGRLLNIVGAATASTTETKYSSSSVYFSGGQDGPHLRLNYDADILEWWKQDYTLECWIKIGSLSGVEDSYGNPNLMGHTNASSSINYWTFGPLSNGSVEWYYYAGAAASFSTDAALVGTSDWHHLAFVFVLSTNTAKIYIDGTERASSTLSSTPQTSSSYPLNIGHGANRSGFNGYIEDLRITKGLARYTSAFTPPSAALKG